MSTGHIVAAVLLGIGGYLVGAIPFGVLVGRWSKGVDIRQHGSGNIGTTNAYRVLGVRAGTLVLVCDIAKGAVPAVLAGHFFAPWLAVILATLPVIGHLRSIFLGGGGGKGVATGAGVVLGLMWPVFLLVVAAFLFVLVTARMVSAASLVSAIWFPIVVWLTGQPLPYLIVSLVLSPLVILAHHANIRRILSGKERRFSFSRHHGDPASHGNAGASGS
jgi:acyl phosphate:glycerol-3-phosphate acyltransferase